MKEKMPQVEDDEYVVTRAQLAGELRRHDSSLMFLGGESTDYNSGEDLGARLERAIDGWFLHFGIDPTSWQSHVLFARNSRLHDTSSIVARSEGMSCGRFLYESTYMDIGIEQNDPDWEGDISLVVALSNEFKVSLNGTGRFWVEHDSEIGTTVEFEAEFSRRDA